jgi:hypothetical protein
MYQLASAYEWRGRIFLHAYSKTTQGLSVLSQPVLEADPGNLPELGRAILSALAGSKEGVPHPSIRDDIPAPLIKVAGAKSRSAFYGSARSVFIKRQSDRVIFTPDRNLGTRKGYAPLKEKVRTSLPDAADLGATLLSAFQDTE